VVDLAKNYSELIKIVEEVEIGATRVEFNSIDISSFEKAQPQIKKPDFKPLLDLAVAIEGGRVKEEPPPKPTPQQQIKQILASKPIKQVMQMQVGTSTSQSSTVQNTVYMPEDISLQVPAAQAPQQQTSTLNQSVKEEIGIFADKLIENKGQPSQPINTFNMKVEGADDIILPKLSTSDQIAELERMIEGVKENSFTADQLNVVKKEAEGLSDAISKEKTGGYGKESSGMEQQLVQLRDRRLTEVLKLMSDIK